MISYLVIGLLSGAAYAVVAVSFVLVYKGTRVFNLAQGEIGGVGLYVAWALLDRYTGVPVIVAALAGMAVSTVVALAVERGLVRRLVDRSPLSALASTLGVALTLAYMESLIWGMNIKTFPSPVGMGRFALGSVTLTAPRIAGLVLAVGAPVGLVLFLRRTRFGLAVWASTSDQVLARLSGVGVGRARSFVWALAGALSGLAAILLASVFTFHPFSNTLILVRAMAAALLGGLTSIQGALLGGLAVGVVESLVMSRTGVAGSADAAIFVLILGTLLFRPAGLMGAANEA